MRLQQLYYNLKRRLKTQPMRTPLGIRTLRIMSCEPQLRNTVLMTDAASPDQPDVTLCNCRSLIVSWCSCFKLCVKCVTPDANTYFSAVYLATIQVYSYTALSYLATIQLHGP